MLKELLKYKKLLFTKDELSCDKSALNFFVWKDYYGLQIINKKYFYCKKFNSFSIPFIKENVNELIKDNIKFTGVTEKEKNYLENKFPNMFEFIEDNDNFDYIYDIDSLCNLNGKKYESKRNLIHQFEKNNYEISIINENNLNDCKLFLDNWYSDKNDDVLLYEKKMLFKVIDNYENIDSLCIFINNECVALAIGDVISDICYDVIFEKADSKYKGSYNIINREFASYIKNKYNGIKYINRENDCGIEGLKKTKLSYNPSIILKKYIVVKKSV